MRTSYKSFRAINLVAILYIVFALFGPKKGGMGIELTMIPGLIITGSLHVWAVVLISLPKFRSKREVAFRRFTVLFILLASANFTLIFSTNVFSSFQMALHAILDVSYFLGPLYLLSLLLDRVNREQVVAVDAG